MNLEEELYKLNNLCIFGKEDVKVSQNNNEKPNPIISKLLIVIEIIAILAIFFAAITYKFRNNLKSQYICKIIFSIGYIILFVVLIIMVLLEFLKWAKTRKTFCGLVAKNYIQEKNKEDLLFQKCNEIDSEYPGEINSYTNYLNTTLEKKTKYGKFLFEGKQIGGLFFTVSVILGCFTDFEEVFQEGNIIKIISLSIPIIASFISFQLCNQHYIISNLLSYLEKWKKSRKE